MGLWQNLLTFGEALQLNSGLIAFGAQIAAVCIAA
jgi:hypothetical protein